ncbi:MAG: hypothetical protein U0798_01060 [Gemmataceae bacterium]
MASDGQRFMKMILNTIMRSLVNRVVWGLPLWLSIILLVVVIAAVWFTGAYK